MMASRRSVSVLLVFGLLAAIARADDPPPARVEPPGPAAKFVYHGFTVDTAGLAGVPDRDREPILASTRNQIEQVEAVRVKPEIADFFRRVPLKFGDVRHEGNLGLWSGRSVRLVAAPIPPERGVLIHELLHAYDSKVLAGGSRERLDRFYEEATHAYEWWDTREYFLSNRAEFFAVTGSIYLRGRSSRPPHDRATLRTAQPEYDRFLGDLFDPPPVPDPPATNP